MFTGFFILMRLNQQLSSVKLLTPNELQVFFKSQYSFILVYRDYWQILATLSHEIDVFMSSMDLSLTDYLSKENPLVSDNQIEHNSSICRDCIQVVSLYS